MTMGVRCGSWDLRQVAPADNDGPELVQIRLERGDGTLDDWAVVRGDQALNLVIGLGLYLGVTHIDLTEPAR
jgi:hypothetical protein